MALSKRISSGSNIWEMKAPVRVGGHFFKSFRPPTRPYVVPWEMSKILRAGDIDPHKNFSGDLVQFLTSGYELLNEKLKLPKYLSNYLGFLL